MNYNPNWNTGQQATSPYAPVPITPSPMVDFTNPNLNAAPIVSMPNYGATNPWAQQASFAPQIPVASPTFDMYGGDLSTAGTAPLSMWESFSNIMKGMHQTLQDWGVTGGKNADGSTFNGWGGMALGAAQGIANWMTGKEQLALQKRAVNSSIKFAEENLAMQKSRVNGDLRDRQVARVASNPGAYQSVGDYMKQNGVA